LREGDRETKPKEYQKARKIWRKENTSENQYKAQKRIYWIPKDRALVLKHRGKKKGSSRITKKDGRRQIILKKGGDSEVEIRIRPKGGATLE